MEKDKGSKRNALVLIVDDVEINREILGEIVSDMGYETQLAESGIQALECIKERLPNLVLSDISMPEMDGYELCRLYALVDVAVKNSQYDEKYIERMRYNCSILAQSMQLSPLFSDVISDNFVDTVQLAAPLCDIGNIGISKDILQKKAALTEEERAIMRDHTKIGTKLLGDLKVSNDYNDFMQISMDITHYHHENWDGSGYPEGKQGNEIPLAAQIVAMSSMFCALTEERSFRRSYDKEEALEIMRQEAQQKFNPDIFNIFCKVARQLR